MLPYLRTQWARFFGLNASPAGPLLYVGGQFRPEQWPLLYALGIRAVLSMQEEWEDRFSGPAPERAHRLLVPDFRAPTLGQLDEGVAFISEAHAAGLPVFVHCHAGVGRAPLMAAAYLVASRGVDHRSALAELRVARPIIAPNALQVGRLREYEALLRARKNG